MPKLLFDKSLDLFNTFVNERNWFCYHHPKNISLSLMDEVGELCELFVEIDSSGWNLEKRTEVSHEMADVLSALLSFCIFFNIHPNRDLPELLERSKVSEGCSLQSFALRLTVEASKLAKLSLWLTDEESRNLKFSEIFKERLYKTLQALVDFASVLSIDLIDASVQKMKLNQKKYPVDLIQKGGFPKRTFQN